MKLAHVAKMMTMSSLVFLAGAVWAASSGSIDQLSGTVTVTDANKVSRKAGPKEQIQSGDTVTTEAKSEVVIKLADESVVALRPNTQFTVTEFKYEKKPTDTTRFSLLRGCRPLPDRPGRTGVSPDQSPRNGRDGNDRHSRHGLRGRG
jgi:hypothetical protein